MTGDPLARAREVAETALAHAPRTRAELTARLRAAEIAPEVVEQLLDDLGAAGVVDDAAFATLWVESRHRSRGLSSRALEQELRRKGIAEETVQEAVQGVSAQDEEAAAHALIARKVAATAGLAPEVRVRRLTGQLARRGYGAGLAYRVVRQALEAEGLEVVLDTDGLSALD